MISQFSASPYYLLPNYNDKFTAAKLTKAIPDNGQIAGKTQ